MGNVVTIFLEPAMRASAEAGEHNFLARVADVLRSGGADVRYADEADRHLPRKGRALVHMKQPMDADTLVFRRVYAYPFWAIEASDKRWEWDVAKAAFDPERIAAGVAQKFVANWRRRLFPGVKPESGGFVYLPLQGRLLERRSFQAVSPIEMIDEVLHHDSRRVVLGLHPKESYTAAEMDALEELERREGRVQVVLGEMERYLPHCDYVVSQNSAAAFFGYFHSKPAVLFGKIDFHHIAANATELGAREALRAGPKMRPDFERYLWWFWQQRSLNAGRPEAEERIAERFEQHGWLK